MDRRQFVAGASVGAAAAVSVYPKPAIAQGARELKMVTIWPKGLPGLQSGADRVAQSITALSGGRLQVKVFPAGQLVGAMESFDAVSSPASPISTTLQKSRGRASPQPSPISATSRSDLPPTKSTYGSITVAARRCGTS